MKKITDKTRARLLLGIREKGGYKVLPFIRMNAKGYLVFGVYFSIALAFLAFTNAWIAFGYVAFFLSGILLRDVSWFIGLRHSWPFVSKVINWDEVKKFADDVASV